MATFLVVAGLLISHVDGSPPPRQRLVEQKSTNSASSGTSRTPPFYVLDPEDYRSYFPDEASFRSASSVAPLLDLPAAADEYSDVLAAYYYRIRSYRKHLRRSDDDKYWVVTEFSPPVPWAGSSNTISAAAGHHIMEGRWFWDAPEFVEDYVRFWYLGGGGRSNSPVESAAYSRRRLSEPQPHISRYTNWIYHAAWRYASLWGFDDRRRSFFRDTFRNAASVFRDVYVEQYLTNSTRNSAAWNSSGRVCWVQDDGKDAMEVSVSGSGCRPTIASAMWGEATALARAAALLGEEEEVIREFQQWASFSRNVITQQHWNPTVKSFAVIPPPKPSDYSLERMSQNPNQRGPNYCDLQKIRTPDQPVNVRELLAFVPWYYSSLLQPRDDENNSETVTMWARQFQWLLDSSGDDGLSGPWGLRTVQRSAPCYNFSWDHGDCWNGPSWPYETSRVLTAVANLLTEQGDASAIEESGVTPREFERLLLQYALQHTRTSAANDTARPPRSGHVFENVHPDLGYWNNRERMYWRDDRNRNMGDDYNHSTFLDLILGSWLGVRTVAAGAADNTPWLVVHPLIQAPYFAVDRIPYRGRVLSVAYDPTGTRYSSTRTNSAIRGLAILVDGRVVAQRPDIGRLVVPVEPQSF